MQDIKLGTPSMNCLHWPHKFFTNGTPYVYWNEILYCTKYIHFVIRLFLAVVTCRRATSQMSLSNILKSVEKHIEPLLIMLIICFHNGNTLRQIYVSWGVHYHRTDDCVITRCFQAQWYTRQNPAQNKMWFL